MHTIIRIICYANDKKEARIKAEDILDNNLVGDYQSFDYGTFFDDDFATSRWGSRPVSCLADSKEGKKLIDEGMKFTKKEFKDNIKKVREALKEYSDEDLFEGKIVDMKKKILQKLEDKKDNNMDLHLFKYRCWNIGDYSGRSIWLYNDDGEGIRNNEMLKDVLEKWKGFYESEGKINPNKDLKVFVVPVDVHY